MATIKTIEETDFASDSRVNINSNFSNLNTNKQEIETGKGLSENDFTTAYKDKLVNLAPNYSLTSVLTSSDNIQDTIDYVYSQGGGVIYLQPGTYTLTSNLTIPSGITLSGTATNSCIIQGSSFSLTITGNQIYNTGTITSITGGVNVVGSGTAWLTNVIPYQSNLFINGQFMLVASVTNDTHLVLAEGYDGSTVSAGSAYRVSTPIQNVNISNLTIKSSTSSGIKINDARYINISNCMLQLNSIGLEVNYGTEISLNNVNSILNTSHGISITKGGRYNWDSVNSISNTGSGIVFNGVRSAGFSTGTSNSNTIDGFNITGCTDLSLVQFDASSNGSNGVECVSSNSSLTFTDAGIRGNTSDGLKLTATTDICNIVGGNFEGNGGYGINIAASTCDNNILMGVIAIGNSSGSLSDSGTGTLKSNTVNILP